MKKKDYILLALVIFLFYSLYIKAENEITLMKPMFAVASYTSDKNPNLINSNNNAIILDYNGFSILDKFISEDNLKDTTDPFDFKNSVKINLYEYTLSNNSILIDPNEHVIFNYPENKKVKEAPGIGDFFKSLEKNLTGEIKVDKLKPLLQANYLVIRREDGKEVRISNGVKIEEALSGFSENIIKSNETQKTNEFYELILYTPSYENKIKYKISKTNIIAYSINNQNIGYFENTTTQDIYSSIDKFFNENINTKSKYNFTIKEDN